MDKKEKNKNLKRKNETKSKEKNPPIWAKLSSSISYYLRSCDLDYSNYEILEDYLEFAYVESEIEGNISKKIRFILTMSLNLEKEIKYIKNSTIRGLVRKMLIYNVKPIFVF